MKILAVDPGTRRIGLAVCDALQWTTRPLPALQVSSGNQHLRQLLSRVIAEEAKTLLIGLPLNMDGSEGEAAKRSRRLAKALERLLKQHSVACQIELWDERLTTFEAEQRLRERGPSKSRRKPSLDSLAAQVILEDYLRGRALRAEVAETEDSAASQPESKRPTHGGRP